MNYFLLLLHIFPIIFLKKNNYTFKKIDLFIFKLNETKMSKQTIKTELVEYTNKKKLKIKELVQVV